MLTPPDVAEIIARAMDGKTRGRFSRESLTWLAESPSLLRTTYLMQLKVHLEMRGYLLAELERGGFGIIDSESLSGAPIINFKGE